MLRYYLYNRHRGLEAGAEALTRFRSPVDDFANAAQIIIIEFIAADGRL